MDYGICIDILSTSTSTCMYLRVQFFKVKWKNFLVLGSSQENFILYFRDWKLSKNYSTRLFYVHASLDDGIMFWNSSLLLDLIFSRLMILSLNSFRYHLQHLMSNDWWLHAYCIYIHNYMNLRLQLRPSSIYEWKLTQLVQEGMYYRILMWWQFRIICFT